MTVLGSLADCVAVYLLVGWALVIFITFYEDCWPTLSDAMIVVILWPLLAWTWATGKFND